MADDETKTSSEKESGAQEEGGTFGSASGDAAASAQPQQDQATAPQAGVIAQYVKDLSFENPKAAQTLRRLAQEPVKPQIQVNINVNAARVGENAYEVDLKVEATSSIEQETAFAVELVYSGLFAARNLPDDVLEQFLLIQGPTVLFPFARRVIADTVRDGGFAPLMLDPIDFALLYRQQKQQAAQGAQPEQSGAASLGTIDLGEPQGNA